MTLDDTTRQKLVKAAQAVRQNAYAPYSNYHVGAALLAEDGSIFTGCNVENATYGATICAERTAIVKAVSEGVRTFRAIVVMTSNGGSPCGICRQTLFEFSQDMAVILVDEDEQIVYEGTAQDLLPLGFSPDKLDI